MPNNEPTSSRTYPAHPPRSHNQSRQRDEDFAPGLGHYEPAGNMKRGEQVEVRIRGNMWIVGFLVSSLHLISGYLGHGYEVEYKDQSSGRAYQGTFREEDVRFMR